MDEQIKEEREGNFIRNALFALKRNIVLFLAVIILFTAGGYVYARVKKPDYTASVKVSFQTYEKNGSSSSSTTDINNMRAYIDTVIDFCDEGVVLDRANWYYKDWLDEKASGKDFNQYLDELKTNDNYSDRIASDDEWYSAQNINFLSYTSDGSTQFVFSIRYTDPDKDAAHEKAELLTLAFANELNVRDGEDGKYFSGFTVKINNLGYEGVSSNVSKKKIVTIALVLGVAIASLAVFVKYLLDNTVKSKEELEQLTGVKTLATIENDGGRENDK